MGYSTGKFSDVSLNFSVEFTVCWYDFSFLRFYNIYSLLRFRDYDVGVSLEPPSPNISALFRCMNTPSSVT